MDLNDYASRYWFYVWQTGAQSAPAPKEGPMPIDPDLEPSRRGATLMTADREDCEWPAVGKHALRLVWDKREDRMAAKIVAVPTIRTEDEKG